MTNAEFDAWIGRHFRSNAAAGRAFGLNHELVKAMREGRSRKGHDTPVPTHVALACAAWTLGIRDYDGGPITMTRELTITVE